MEFTKVQTDHWKQIKEIYSEAFPKAERKPFFLLKTSKKVQLFAAVETGSVLGFVAAIPMENLVMVDYLAVNSNIRSKGTGSFLIQELCRVYEGKKIVLLIEKLDDSSENAQQRIDRRRFYLKNGFTSSDLFVHGTSGTMEIMNFGGSVTAEEYLKLQKYALGRILFNLSKMQLVPSK